MTKDSGESAVSNVNKKQKDHHRRLHIRRHRQITMSNPQSSASSAESENTDTCCTQGHSTGGVAYGHVVMMGRRRVMEDVVAVAPPIPLAEGYTFFAVYDGHGGAKVAEKCGEKMHTCVEKHVAAAKEIGFDWERIMVESFRSMDEDLEEECRSNEAAAEERMMGSTATVVLLGKEEVVVANCGDSRAVLYRGGLAVPLSRDHKPDREDEKERIEAAGGKVINWNGWRVEGVLSTSRSLGDQYLKPYITSEPEVTVVRRSQSDDFIIIATDGLFDVVCNEVACNVVKRCLNGQLKRRQSAGNIISEAAAMLAELAIAKGSKDNISIIIVQMM